MSTEFDTLEDFLGPLGSWRRDALAAIQRIPRGSLATYGRIAEIVRQGGHSVGARNIAWFRERLYGILGHDTDVPLHRVARAGDIGSLADSDETQKLNTRLRREEGFFNDPRWI